MKFASKDRMCMIFVHSWTTSGWSSDDCFSGRWLNWCSEGEVGWGFRYFFVPCPCSWTENWMEYMQGAEIFGCDDLLTSFRHVIAILSSSGSSSFIFTIVVYFNSVSVTHGLCEPSHNLATVTLTLPQQTMWWWSFIQASRILDFFGANTLLCWAQTCFGRTSICVVKEL